MPQLKSKFCIDEQKNKILARNKTKNKGDSSLTRVASSASGIIKKSKKQKGVMKCYPSMNWIKQLSLLSYQKISMITYYHLY